MTSFIIIMLIVVTTGCQKKELTRFQQPYVVSQTNSLPYFDSWQEYNSKSVDEIISQLAYYNGDESYLLVDNKGNVMKDEEFARKKSRDFSEELVLVDKIKNHPLFIVQEGFYYVTTVEKEIKALFDGERKIIRQEELEKILSDNQEAYKKKDYETILTYLAKKNIMVWKSYGDS